jgi:hypothetical protein
VRAAVEFTTTTVRDRTGIKPLKSVSPSLRLAATFPSSQTVKTQEAEVNNIIYIVGFIVVLLAILSFLGLR